MRKAPRAPPERRFGAYFLFIFESQGPNQGSYTLWVNGTPVLEGSISGLTTTNTPFSLGSTVDAQFICVAFWSTALPEGERLPTGNWVSIALNSASLILMVVGLFTSGGAYLAVVLAQLLINIAILIAVIAQKPSNCC